MITNKLLYYTIIFLVSILFATGAFLKFSTQHEKLPADCDEFGYLNMAKAFSNNNAFNDHAPRPFFNELIQVLKQHNLNETDYVWMIVPHAYHFSSKTNRKVINQYAPGTSYLLSWIPINYRKMSFLFLVMIFTFLIPFIYVVLKKMESLQTIIALTLLMLLLSISTPFITEIARINSLAFTFGLFIIVGLSAVENPLIALFFIVLSANFRVVNLLMLLPLSLFFIQPLFKYVKTSNWKTLVVFVVKCILIILIALTPYLFYVTKLLGNPFIPTYPSHDTNFVRFDELFSNISFYFSFKESWFIAHIIAIIILFFQVKQNQLSKKTFLIWLTFPLVNYVFFSFHKVQMSYYPFASVFILFGAIIYYFSKNRVEVLNRKYMLIIPIIISIIMCCDGVVRYSKKQHLTFEAELKNYQPLCNYDVVWGEMHSGTSEYVCNISGFKYNFGTPKAREITLKYLRDKGYSQVIICDDINIKTDVIVNEISSYHIHSKLIESSKLGKLLIIQN